MVVRAGRGAAVDVVAGDARHARPPERDRARDDGGRGHARRGRGSCVRRHGQLVAACALGARRDRADHVRVAARREPRAGVCERRAGHRGGAVDGRGEVVTACRGAPVEVVARGAGDRGPAQHDVSGRLPGGRVLRSRGTEDGRAGRDRDRHAARALGPRPGAEHRRHGVLPLPGSDAALGAADRQAGAGEDAGAAGAGIDRRATSGGVAQDRVAGPGVSAHGKPDERRLRPRQRDRLPAHARRRRISARQGRDAGRRGARAAAAPVRRSGRGLQRQHHQQRGQPVPHGLLLAWAAARYARARKTSRSFAPLQPSWLT